MEVSSTETFGKISFIGEDVTNTKLTEYIRLSYRDDVNDVMNLMFNYWNIEVGTLCISVIDSARNFKMRKQVKNTFCQGLIKALKTTNALIITSGLNVGITKIVGDAIQNGQNYLYDKTKRNNFICCLGISPWGYVKGNQFLEKAKGKVIHYKLSNEIKMKHPISLNKNHTHYLFVDDGTRHLMSTEAGTFRAEFEKKLSQGIEGRNAIPVIHLIVEGGHDILTEARRSVSENFPIVICEGTGRASDILGEAFRKMQKRPTRALRKDGVPMLPIVYRNNLKKKLIEKNVTESNRVDEAIRYIEDIISYEHLITLFDMRGHEDLDVVILHSLIKQMDFIGDSKQNIISKQLSLCLLWNRVDIAKSKILSGPVSLTVDEWGIFLNDSIKNGKVEFLELILQNGAVMQDFLTNKRLKELYEDWPTNENFKQTFLKLIGRNFQHGLSDVKLLLSNIFEKFDNPNYTTEDELTHPFQELFLWSVLMEKHDCANYFWEKTEESLCLALVATKIYECIGKTYKLNIDRTETLNKWKDYFENLAIKLLEECYNSDQETAAYIIEKENKIWGGYTCLELAYKAKDEKFISCMVCQNSIDFTWRAGFNINLIQCFLCIIFPCFIYKRSYDFNYIKDKMEPTEDLVENENINNCVYLTSKLQQFYLAPQTKFCIHSFTYFAFVIYFSFVLLFGMKRMEVTYHEVLFIFYIICMIMEKICEIIQAKADKIHDRVKYWWNFNNWNKFDFLILLLVVSAMLLRLQLAFDRWNEDRIVIYRYTKTIYSVTVGYFYLRFIHLLCVNKKLGPKIAMIEKMFHEMMHYLIIILIILLSYGVTSQGSYYPQRDFNINTLLNVFDFPYWTIFGDINYSKLVYLDWCPDNTNYNISNDCPEKNYFVPLITAVYIFVSNILLLNVLIAVFSHIFIKIHTKSIDVWKFTMYSVVIEYDLKPILPLPLSLLIYIYDLGFFIYWKIYTKNEMT